MKVLWLSPTPAMYDEKKYGSWVASLEVSLIKYCKDVSLGIAFEYSNHASTVKKNGVTYYPINVKTNAINKFKSKFGLKSSYEYELINKILNIIDDFKPDIIQCFGTEFRYALITQFTKIPVVVHMQGFLNVYNLSELMAFSKYDRLFYELSWTRSIYHALFDIKNLKKSSQLEIQAIKENHYFLGRTSWDKNIVKYYSPQSRYYYCAEVLRPEIYGSEKRWKWKEESIPTFVTITQAGYLKGNEIILLTAKILKEQFHFNFCWKVAGRKDSFEKFEKKTGIKHEDVNIDLIGMISAKQVVEELCDSRLYIHPAIIDNSPNSLCEAQVIGCPVIATYVGGIPDLVNNNQTGFLYPYNEPHTLAFKIMSIANDKELLTKISENEIAVATDRHDPKKIVNNLYDIYKEIIEENNKKNNDK